jgi:hypothetical protein
MTSFDPRDFAKEVVSGRRIRGGAECITLATLIGHQEPEGHFSDGTQGIGTLTPASCGTLANPEEDRQ